MLKLTEKHKTDYIGNFIYKNGILQYIISPEGRIIPNATSGYDYEYHLKDHLGNTRVAFVAQGTTPQIVQETPR